MNFIIVTTGISISMREVFKKKSSKWLCNLGYFVILRSSRRYFSHIHVSAQEEVEGWPTVGTPSHMLLVGFFNLPVLHRHRSIFMVISGRTLLRIGIQ